MIAGDWVIVSDYARCNVVKFIYLRDNGWVAIAVSPVPEESLVFVRNGLQMGWQWIAGYLVQVAKIPVQQNAYYEACSNYTSPMILQPVMRVSEVAALLGRTPDEIRAELADYLVQMED